MTAVVLLSILLFVCILLSGFFSGAEMAFSSANVLRLEKLKEQGSKRAKVALFIAEHFEDALSAILIGNNLVNIAASSIGSVIVILLFGNAGYAWISTTLVTIAVIVFGETIPKIVSKKKPTTRSISFAYPVRGLMLVLKPAVLFVTFLVRFILLSFPGQEEPDDSEESVEELQSIIETAEDEGILDENDTEIINNAIDFAEISASEVMTARVDVQAIDIDDNFKDIMSFVEKTPYSRIPVFQDSMDNIIGILHLNNFLKAVAENGSKVDIKSLLMPTCYVYKTMKLPTVLNILKKAKQHLAVVTDEYSGTLGIISMEDVLGQIVGEIWDETDVIEDDVVVKNETECEIDGDLSIGDFLDLLEIEEDDFEAESETVGGWVVEMLEKFPKKGDKFTFRNFEITVLSVDVRRVERIKLLRIHSEQ